MTIDPFAASLATHRAELLRHCYRMLGSFADAEETVQDVLTRAWTARESYSGAAPLRHWLFRIATHACLNVRRAQRSRTLPDRIGPPSAGNVAIGAQLEAGTWVTPAPDTALFGEPTASDTVHRLEERERVTLAFVALLQGLPPRGRAVLLLKDVVGFAVDEIAETLQMSESAVASALHRARAALPLAPREDQPEPSPDVLRAYVRCWETRDLDGLLALLRDDVVLMMPPWPMWFRGRAEVKAFVTSPRFTAFWSSGLRVVPTRANGGPAVVFHRDGGLVPHSVQLLRYDGRAFVELCNLVGPDLLHGF